MMHADRDTEMEVLDIDHLGLVYRWWNQSPDRGDRSPLDVAVATSMIEAVDPATGERVAYVKVSYTTEEFARTVFPTALHYQNSRGWSLNFAADPTHVWADAHRYARTSPASCRQRRPGSLSAATAPDAETIAADLAVLASRYEAVFSTWIEAFSIPFVAYSRIIEGPDYRPGNGEPVSKWARRGVATTLYEGAARRLATTGRVLRASGIISDDAKALWASFTEKGMPVSTVTASWSDDDIRTYDCLDYR